MKIEYLNEFLMLSKMRNYVTAADELFISTSALSRHILSLEDEIGEKLFNREWRNITLTPAGNMLVPYAERIVAEYNDYFAMLSDRQNKEKIVLTVGFIRSAIQYGILDKLIMFREESTHISLLLTENNPSSLYALLKNNECDFIFSYDYKIFEDPELEKYDIIKDELAIALPADHNLAQRDSIRIEELKAEHFILHQKGGSSYKHAMQLFNEAGCRPEIQTNAEDGQYILELVAKGVGISFVEKERFKNLYPQNIKVIDLDPPVTKRVALFFKKHELSQLEKEFLHFVLNFLKADHSK